MTAAQEKLLIDSLENSLTYQHGVIKLGDGIATLNVPKGFKYLDATQTEYVVTTLWGNPKGNVQPLGMIVPEEGGVLSDGSYGYIVSYEAMGFVKDEDAEDINYDDLLKELKTAGTEENKEREKLGLGTLNLVGWAESPHYDKNKKILYWAKEYSIPGSDVNTLNYDMRILGRKGVLTVQAVSTMKEWSSVNKDLPSLLGMVSFTEGNRYSDYESGTDNVAAWTIGGLVAGKVLAKVGFFALFLKYIKLIFAGLVLVGGAIWRFITGRRKKQAEYSYAPATTEQPGDTPIE